MVYGCNVGGSLFVAIGSRRFEVMCLARCLEGARSRAAVVAVKALNADTIDDMPNIHFTTTIPIHEVMQNFHHHQYAFGLDRVDFMGPFSSEICPPASVVSERADAFPSRTAMVTTRRREISRDHVGSPVQAFVWLRLTKSFGQGLKSGAGAAGVARLGAGADHSQSSAEGFDLATSSR